MENSEYLTLQDQLQDHFDGRYVKIEDCEKRTVVFDKTLNEDNIRLAVIEQQQKINANRMKRHGKTMKLQDNKQNL